MARNIKVITEGTPHKIDVSIQDALLSPGTVRRLKTSVKRKSFELYRTNLRNIEIVTYDELFRKMETLATLFNLIRKAEKA